MWLVLTTALRGDGLIGLIASDRLGWTSYRKTAARCGSLLAILYVLLSFFPSIVTLHLLFPHYRFASLFASFYLINSVFISSCLQTVCFFTLSHFFLHLTSTAVLCTNYTAAVKLECQYCQFFLLFILQCYIQMIQQAFIPLSHTRCTHTRGVSLCHVTTSVSQSPAPSLPAAGSLEAVTRSEVVNWTLPLPLALRGEKFQLSNEKWSM